jgi:P4 family phage/plasmid primase-like protien
METSSNQYKDLNGFLAKHSAKIVRTDTHVTPTHTRIPDKKLNIYGGAYIIPKEELGVFMGLYHKSVFTNKHPEYLTEKQLSGNGGILIDVDLRYNHDVDARIHTKEHIVDLISSVYLEELKKLLVFKENTEFPIYVFEKPDVNRLEDGSLTKDGIHIIIGIQMDHILQMILREKVIESVHEIWELPIINSWDSVFDDGISKGTTNWQMYGSKKPGNQAYELTQYYMMGYDERDGEFMMEELETSSIDLSKDLIKLSAQYDDHAKFDIHPNIKDEFDRRKNSSGKKTGIKKNTSRTKLKLLCATMEDEDNTNITLEHIDGPDKLKNSIDKIMESLHHDEHFIKEAHEYTQILPEKYYNPGSHEINRRVAFALKHTDDRLFLSWVMLRSKADDFDYSTIPELFEQWTKYFNVNGSSLTIRSIMYWAKQDAFDQYERVKKDTLDHYIEVTMKSPTEFDFAKVLLHIYKDTYVCSSLIGKTWYTFKNHRWVLDKGQSLRMAISVEMYNAYHQKLEMWQNEMQHYDPTDERYTSMCKLIRTGTELSLRLKKTNDKNNIMKEALELFFDPNFEKNMDTNKWLVGFNNGVVDLKNKEFRDGRPLDYITKSTGIDHIPFSEVAENPYVEKINTFMLQLFPLPSLRKYMWEHLSSVLIGENINQTFNIYRGTGSNGKSMLTDLMAACLGEYYGEVPVNLVTDKRPSIGGTTSEIMKLKGVRYAVMQEPSKDNARINEGMMKQLTGDSKLSGRQLYSETETFLIQFQLCVCTNTLFEVGSNDDGTWRRIRICEFMAKFYGADDNDGFKKQAHSVPKDKGLKDKLSLWAPVFMSMLVNHAYENQGIVNDCDIVKASSNKYRQGQDHISAFITEMVCETQGKKISRRELCEQFKLWFQDQQGGRRQPKGAELCEYMDSKYGKPKSGGWKNVEIIYNEEEDELEEMDM